MVLGAPRKSPPSSSAQKVHGVVDQLEPASQSTASRLPTTTTTNTMTQTAAKPVPIRPKQRQHTPDADVDIMSPDDGHADDMALERDPESEEIVKQLEKGLPRWPGFSEEGWMDETPLVCPPFFSCVRVSEILIWSFDRRGCWTSFML